MIENFWGWNDELQTACTTLICHIFISVFIFKYISTRIFKIALVVNKSKA
jgi:hypothetical protein